MKKLFTLLLVMTLLFTTCFSTGTVYAADKKTPEGTPIYTVEDLKAMENNPSGSYYLAADIQLPENFTIFQYVYLQNNYFTGTLDGNGYKLIGYTVNHNGGWYEGAFIGGAKGATLKNLHFTEVNVNITSNKGMRAGVVVGYTADACTFSKIVLEGKVSISGNSQSNYVFGGVAPYLQGSATSCYNKMSISCNAVTKYSTMEMAGISPSISKGYVKGCRNYGNITFKGYTDSNLRIYGIGNVSGKISYCRNSGKISVTLPTDKSINSIKIAGITGENGESITSSYNSGKITVKNVDSDDVAIAGLATDAKYLNKCYNKGAIAVSGKMRGNIGGLAAVATETAQSYNKGKMAVTVTKGNVNVGGVAGTTYGMKYCYNTAALTLNQDSHDSKLGGLAGDAIIWGGSTLRYCYATGKVTASTWFKGTLLGSYSGADIDGKRNIYNNYYTGSAKPYGTSSISWKDWTAKATKVSSITAKNCPKLSSKIWTYHKELKRLVLKNNKEK